MKWDEQLATGVTKIDEQHKDLFKRMDKIAEACKSGAAKDELMPTLMYLRRYVDSHFSDEEELQNTSEYPKREEHKRQHKLFMEKVDSLFNECEEEGATLTTILKTNTVINNLLVTHINNHDKEFAKYFRTK